MAQKLSEILNGMEIGIGRTIAACRTLSLWNRVVGERVGKQTEAVKIRNRVLYVSTSSAAWAQELSFLKNEFIKKFNAEAGKEAIQDIRFRSGG